ncbi:glycosyltransferase [Patescibacteria group bacterium]
MAKPKLSAIMPVKDREDLIGMAINSVLKQTFQNWELIIINDHSTDNTEKIIKQYSDPRIKLFNQTKDKHGIAAARNLAVDKSQADIIVPTDSDDYNYPQRFQKIVDYFEKHPDTDLYYGRIELYYIDTKKTVLRYHQEYKSELLRYINFVPQPAVAYKKSTFLELGKYNETLEVSEDYDLWLRMSEKNKKFGSEDEIVVKLTKHPGSVRAKDVKGHKSVLEVVREKHNIHIRDLKIERFKELANPEVFDFYTEPQRIKLWFGEKAEFNPDLKKYKTYQI